MGKPESTEQKKGWRGLGQREGRAGGPSYVQYVLYAGWLAGLQAGKQDTATGRCVTGVESGEGSRLGLAHLV